MHIPIYQGPTALIEHLQKEGWRLHEETRIPATVPLKDIIIYCHDSGLLKNNEYRLVDMDGWWEVWQRDPSKRETTIAAIGDKVKTALVFG